MRTGCTIVVLLSLFIVEPVIGQRAEIGFGIGTFNYTGDLAQRYHFGNSRPAATVFYRSNLSKVASIRAALTGGGLAASDDLQRDVFAEQRNASFSIFVLEASAVMEYHFLNWRDTKNFIRYSPYLFGGLALFGISGNESRTDQYSNVQGAIPFGVGIKYIVNPKWYVSLEFGARKTFFDYLDDVSLGDPDTKDFQYGNPFDNDTYYFLGFGITRTFYDIPCPTNPYR